MERELSIHLKLSTRHRMAKNTIRNSMYFLCAFCFCYYANLVCVHAFACSLLLFKCAWVGFQYLQKILEKLTKSRFARFCKFFANFLQIFQSYPRTLSEQQWAGKSIHRKLNCIVAQTKCPAQITYYCGKYHFPRAEISLSLAC